MALPLSFFSHFFLFLSFSGFSLSLSLFFLSFFLSLVQPNSAATIKARASKHQDHDRWCWVLILSHQVTSLSNPEIKLRRWIGLSPGRIVRLDASQRLEALPANRTKPRLEIKLHGRIEPRALLLSFFSSRGDGYNAVRPDAFFFFFQSNTFG